jgi:hypothetical protein
VPRVGEPTLNNSLADVQRDARVAVG